MPRRVRVVPFAAVLLALSVTPRAADADAIGNCTGNAVSLAVYGPCLLPGGILLSNLTATVDGVDVSRSQQLSMTLNYDAHPPDAKWLFFNVPVAGDFEHELSEMAPLQVGFHLSGIDRARPVVLDMVLWNRAMGGYTRGVEFEFSLDNGMTLAEPFGRPGEPEQVIRILPWAVGAMDVRVRLTGNSPDGGPAVGLFVGAASDTAPVPEPATMTLLGGGMALLFARARRRKSE